MARASIPSTSRVNLTRSCILFHFYIKPQPAVCLLTARTCCILFHFYIKPQLIPDSYVDNLVVSYSISTSNHNYTILQNTPLVVVSYSISTSNHNSRYSDAQLHSLYLIPFLHQTTTDEIKHAVRACCILFHFYIKPQRFASSICPFLVVSYSISTSNHNSALEMDIPDVVVSYSISTSNHNTSVSLKSSLGVVSYSISTSNHNLIKLIISEPMLYLIPFLHQTTTVPI